MTVQTPYDRYIEILFHWNTKIRLAGEKDPDVFRSVHLEEARRVIPLLRGLGWQAVVDIGSGNGLMAVPLAVEFPSRTVIALEPNRKKCIFLRQLKQNVPLPNLEVRMERLETFQPPAAGSALLWSARALEISPDVLLAALRRRPASVLLLFTSPQSPFHSLMRHDPPVLRVLESLPLSADSHRMAVLAEIR